MLVKDGIASIQFDNNNSCQSALEEIKINCSEYNFTSKDIFPYKFNDSMLLIQLFSVKEDMLESLYEYLNSLEGVTSIVCT